MESSVEKALRPVKEILPHREPFLFLDEVIEMTDSTVVATRTVRADEPQFQGHYPGRPIMPGVLLCETILQCGAYLMAVKLGEDASMKGAPVVARMNSVKFKRMVQPGDVLRVEAEHVRTIKDAHMMKGRIRRDDTLVASLDFTVTLVDDSKAGG
ncbi:MAG: 3-hydroxyacyl-ACP dehydratase FabZ [Myxococcota bacterium]